MSTYRVSGTIGASCWTVVEADSPEEAVQIAKHRSVAEHSIDGSYQEDECWNFDNDGIPDNFTVEEE